MSAERAQTAAVCCDPGEAPTDGDEPPMCCSDGSWKPNPGDSNPATCDDHGGTGIVCSSTCEQIDCAPSTHCEMQPVACIPEAPWCPDKLPACVPDVVDDGRLACQSNADCEVKDVHNCCGYYPQCVNRNFVPDVEAVERACEESGDASICGFPVITGCECTEGQCRDSGLKGGVLAVFAVGEERFAIFVTNPETCEQIIALRDGRSSAAIPVGRVRRGAVSYNSPWSWHIDPEEVTMAEAAIELCDAAPSYIEAHLDEWIEKVVRFCPWRARLVSLHDYR